MPEIKNSFRQGIMNKDDDERLIPNGQYRDALNIQITTSDDSDVGTVQNILGNTLVGEDKHDSTTLYGVYGDDLKCVGTVADEKNDTLYYFLWAQKEEETGIPGETITKIINYIIEYGHDGEETLVFVDRQNVLKFDPNNIITGINIIDNLIFWTDNFSEPKKINIDTCKEGTTNIGTHTRLYVNGVDEGDIKEEHVTVIRKKPEVAPTVKFVETAIQPVFVLQDIDMYQKIVGDIIRTDSNTLPELILGAGATSPLQVGDKVFLSAEGTGGFLPSNAQVEGEVLNVLTITNGFKYRIEIKDIAAGSTLLFGDGVIRDYNLIKDTDYKAIFETDFIRFAIRYKYQDGEYSAFSPFTQPVFLAGPFGFHPTRDPFNLGMENKITNVRLQDLVASGIPKDVVQIDILFKKERSTTIYSIDSIKPNDPSSPGSQNYWNDNSYVSSTILNTNYGYNSDGSLSDSTDNHVSFTYDKKGAYEITTENVYAALPDNQILRPYDNVPRRALAQEITGNRLVYANYLQNYDFLSKEGDVVKPDIVVSKENRSFENTTPDFINSRGLPSIKSVRKYYLGVVFGDEYGRETPVFTSKNASINIPYDNNEDAGFDNNADKSLRLAAKMNFLPDNTNPPDWASYFKYYIKQTTGEYYNLVLDRVYSSDIDETFWISFPSSDRNKIEKGDYFTMKKQVDIEEMVREENKIKIIDIKNEAPETIKLNFSLIGAVDSGQIALNTNTGAVIGNGLYPNSANIGPKPGSKKFLLRKIQWTGDNHPDLIESLTPSDRLAVRFFITESGVKIYSQKYLVVSYDETTVNSTTPVYRFTLKTPIKQKDGWIIDPSNQAINISDNLGVEIFKVEQKQPQEFEGRFFVKVVANELTRKYLITSVQDLYAYEVLAIAPTFALFDQVGIHSLQQGAASEGIYLPYQMGGVTNTTGNNLTNTEAEWDAATTFSSGAGSKKGWFVDSSHWITLAPGQQTVPDAYDSGVLTLGTPWAKQGGSSEQYPINGWEAFVSTFTNGVFSPYGRGIIEDTSGPVTYDQNGQPDQVTTYTGPTGCRHMITPLTVRHYTDGLLVNLEKPHSVQSIKGEDLFMMDIKTDGQYLNNNYVYKKKDGGKCWMHYSFSCPGVDLHDGDFTAFENWLDNNAAAANSNLSKQTLVQALFDYALDRISASAMYLEHDTGTQAFTVGNAVNNGSPEEWERIFATPASLSSTAQTEALAAFDIGFLDSANQAVENNIINKTKFQFAGDDQNIYEILDVHRVNVYNHTSWNPNLEHDYGDGGAINSTGTGPNLSTPNNSSLFGIANAIGQNIRFPKSVAGAFDTFVRYLKQQGWTSMTTNHFTYTHLKNTIVNFGKANNRRVTFILQLDKDPRDGIVNPEDFTATTSTDLRFVDNKLDLENNIPTSPAIFETEAKEDVDLNIYYEASNAIPVQLRDAGTDSMEGHLLAPVGSKVFCEANSYAVLGTQNLTYPGLDFYPKVAAWDGDELTINNPGLRDWGAPPTIADQNASFQGKLIKFYREDLSYTSAIIDEVIDIADTPAPPGQQPAPGKYVTKVRLRKQIFERKVGLPWYNCFSFGNGVESNRIRDDFNETFILNGVKASTVLEKQYKEDRRKYGLIYSGLYNSTSGINNLNQFIQAEKITKDVNPTFGSIQKLYSRTRDLVTLCEDKVLQIFVDRDLLFNADGNTNLLASNRFLGTVQPFRGKFGISKNPESFAAESFRAYFTDRQRGAVLRLSLDGLTPISEAGMSDWFRDNLVNYPVLYGSYDSYNGDYNLTLRGDHDIDIITNFVGEGGGSNGGSYGGSNGGSGEKFINPGDEITVTYSEKSKGWVSFKSFVPEISISAVNQYYSFKNGQIWKHHTNETRNSFYGEEGYISTITPVLNASPEVVKNFNTLNYEGTQAKVDAFATNILPADDFQVGSTMTLGSDIAPDVVVSNFNNGSQSSTLPGPGQPGVIINSNMGANGVNGGLASSFFTIPLPSNTVGAYQLQVNYKRLDANSYPAGMYLITAAISTTNVTTYIAAAILDESDNNQLVIHTENLNIPPGTANLFLIFVPVGADMASYAGAISNFITIVPFADVSNMNNFVPGSQFGFNIEDIILQEQTFEMVFTDGEYYNLTNKNGWYVQDIFTNKQQGAINEFIEKEGKWFNYIKGNQDQVDTAAFNFQGLGIVDNIEQF